MDILFKNIEGFESDNITTSGKDGWTFRISRGGKSIEVDFSGTSQAMLGERRIDLPYFFEEYIVYGNVEITSINLDAILNTYS